jgi:Mrp family chromosome partitioning ATPase
LAAARVGELQTRIATLQAAISQTTDSPELAVLLDEQAEARRRLADLQTRRDQISVDADLAGSGVVFYDVAETAYPSSVGLWVVLGGLFGTVVGSGLAFLLAQRRRRFAARGEPERVLGAPLLTDIPHFSQERLRTALPVTDSPASAAAEAFRFVATGITVQQIDRSGNGAAVFKSVAITSAGLYDGKTTVTANTALAAAREGSKVLVVDADFGSGALTTELLGNVQPPMGMTDVAQGTVGLGEAVLRVTKEYAGTVSLLTRGTAAIHAPDFFASQQAAKMFEAAARDFDLVIIDAPPLLRVAYTTTIVRLADRVIVVVGHGSDLSLAEEMRHRLALIGTPTLGYVYNQAPLRTEMTLSGGSMAYTVSPQAPTRK